MINYGFNNVNIRSTGLAEGDCSDVIVMAQLSSCDLYGWTTGHMTTGGHVWEEIVTPVHHWEPVSVSLDISATVHTDSRLTTPDLFPVEALTDVRRRPVQSDSFWRGGQPLVRVPFSQMWMLVFDIYYRTWGHTFCQRNVSVKNNQLWIMQNHPFYHLKYMLLHWFSSPLLWTMLYEKYITSIICSIVQYWQRYALDWVPF